MIGYLTFSGRNSNIQTQDVSVSAHSADDVVNVEIVSRKHERCVHGICCSIMG